MEIRRLFNLKRLSLLLYIISLATPILKFTVHFHDSPGEPPSEELLGINALLFGWGWVPIPTLPWLTNVVYLLLIFNRIQNQFLNIILSVVIIYFASNLMSFKEYMHISSWDNFKELNKVEVVYGFYLWITSYILLTVHLIKNFAQQKINSSRL